MNGFLNLVIVFSTFHTCHSLESSQKFILLDAKSETNIYEIHRHSYLVSVSGLLDAVYRQTRATTANSTSIENCWNHSRLPNQQAACLVGKPVRVQRDLPGRAFNYNVTNKVTPKPLTNCQKYAPNSKNCRHIRHGRSIKTMLSDTRDYVYSNPTFEWLSQTLPQNLNIRQSTFTAQLARLETLSTALGEQLTQQLGESTPQQLKLYNTVSGIVKSILKAESKSSSNLKVISPRFLPITSSRRRASDMSILSPDIMSLTSDDDNSTLSFDGIVSDLIGVPKTTSDYLKSMLLHLSGTHAKVQNVVDWLDQTPKSSEEALIKTHLTTTELFANVTTHMMSPTQTSQMRAWGWTLMNNAQMDAVYGRYSAVGANTDGSYWHEWKRHGVDEMFRRQLQRMARRRRSEPADMAIFKPGVLSPSVIGVALLEPGLFNPGILSPAALQAAALSPAIGSPSILSPAVLTAASLSPTLLSPSILSPGALQADILSPYGLNPSILSPKVLTLEVLNPNFLSPSILSPKVLSPAYLSPAVLGPSILSPSILS